MGIFGRKRETEKKVEDTWTPPLETEEAKSKNRKPLEYRVADYRAHILESISPLNASAVNLIEAVDLTLSETLISDLNLPMVDLATVNGYAFNAQETVGTNDMNPIGLRIVEVDSEIDVVPPELPKMSAMRVVTGAPLPAGANTVIPENSVTISNNLLIFAREPKVNQNIYAQGTELAEGDVLARMGDTLTPQKLALIAESGIDKVLVRMHPRVVVLNCVAGSVSPGVPLKSVVERYASTLIAISAAAEAAGADVYIGSASGSAERISEIINAQLIRADLVITIGGLAENGILQEVSDAYGGFAKVNLANAAEQGFNQLGENDTPWIMLPADLGSAFISFHHFVRPAIRKLAGLPPMAREIHHAKLLSSATLPEGINTLPGFVSEAALCSEIRVEILGDITSPTAKDLAKANCLVQIPAEKTQITAGELVECWMLAENR